MTKVLAVKYPSSVDRVRQSFDHLRQVFDVPDVNTIKDMFGQLLFNDSQLYRYNYCLSSVVTYDLILPRCFIVSLGIHNKQKTTLVFIVWDGSRVIWSRFHLRPEAAWLTVDSRDAA